MEAIRSLYNQYAEGYSLLHTSPIPHSLSSSLSSAASSDRDSRSRDHSPANIKPFEPKPIISWRTNPKFEVAINYRGLGRHVRPMLIALLPSFVLPSRNRKARKLFPTSYLDGLRGVAAFFVVVHHYTIEYTASSPTGWGLDRGGQGAQNWFWLLPVVRVVHAGRFMVVIFFVLSGYVLSYRSLKLARQGKHMELFDSLASSVFRRWLRLHLPVAASCFLGFILARWNTWHMLPEGWSRDPVGKSHIEPQITPFPTAKGTFFEQLSDLYLDVRQMTNPFLFGHITVSRYNIGVLWTIPIEWQGSMITFVTVLGIARTKTWVKLSVLFLLYYRCHQLVHWEWAAFFSGIFLAELSFIWARPLDQPDLSAIQCDEEKDIAKGQTKRYRFLACNSFFVFLFILGIFLGAQPKDSWHKTPGYKWMFEHLPPSYANHTSGRATFWPSIGAVFLIFALEMAPFLQSIFTTSFAQYLGEISFSLYMIHCQVQFTLGGWLVPRCMELTGGWENGQLGFLAGIALSLLVLAPITFWVADVFSRLVDERCVRFARWVSTRCFVKL